MSSPPNYTPSQTYTTYQANHQLPGPAIQGSDLDAEFNRLKTTTDALINNLNLLQRGDGALNNGIVTPDSISSSLAILIAGWNIKGAWVTSTSYVLKDYVTNGGNGYVCIIANTSGVFATDLAAGKWALVSTAGPQGIQGIPGIQGVAGASGITRPGFVNRIINGDFAIDQRNESASQTLTAAATVAYTVDRWYAGCSGANITGQKAIGTGQNASAYQFTGAASNTGLVFGHRIESVNIADLINQQVTVQVWLSSTSISVVTWKTFVPNTIDSWGTKTTSGTGTETLVDTGTIAITSTPTLYTFTTNLGSSAGRGIDLEFSCGALLGTQTLLFQAVQMEFGATANPFERQSFDIRLARCQRYYEKSYSAGTVAGTATTPAGSLCIQNMFSAGGGAFISVRYTLPKRAIPTVTVYSANSGASGQASENTTDRAATVNDPATSGCNISATPIGSGGTAKCHYTAVAEL